MYAGVKVANTATKHSDFLDKPFLGVIWVFTW